MGNLSAVRQRTESIGISPLRGSHRAARRQKYHYSVMALSYGEAIIHLPSTYRSFPQWEIIAFVTDVAHHHRNVTEECVFSFQGAKKLGDFSEVCRSYGRIVTDAKRNEQELRVHNFGVN